MFGRRDQGEAPFPISRLGRAQSNRGQYLNGAGGHQNGRGRVFPKVQKQNRGRRVSSYTSNKSSCQVEYESTAFFEVNTYLKYFM